jgi:hypothetical protein
MGYEQTAKSVPPTSFIYVIGSQRPRAPVKIGVSTTPAQRLGALRTSHHDDLFILAHGPGGRTEEQVLHRMFAGERLRGEWFKRSGGIINLIDFLSDGGLVCDLIAQWKIAKPALKRVGYKPPILERFMQRQVTRRAKKVKHNEWDNICSPAEWQKYFEDGAISATKYAETLASLAAARDITEAERADIEMRQHALKAHIEPQRLCPALSTRQPDCRPAKHAGRSLTA